MNNWREVFLSWKRGSLLFQSDMDLGYHSISSTFAEIKQSLDPILEGMGVIGEMSAVPGWDQLPLSIDEHGVAEDALRVIGFPMKRFRPKEEYEGILAAIRQAQQQAQQAQMMLEAAKVLPAVSKNVEENSILAKVTG